MVSFFFSGGLPPRLADARTQTKPQTVSVQASAARTGATQVPLLPTTRKLEDSLPPDGPRSRTAL